MFKRNISVHVFSLWIVVLDEERIMDRHEAVVYLAKDIILKIVT
jgi:hypothetical protein